LLLLFLTADRELFQSNYKTTAVIRQKRVHPVYLNALALPWKFIAIFSPAIVTYRTKANIQPNPDKPALLKRRTPQITKHQI